MRKIIIALLMLSILFSNAAAVFAQTADIIDAPAYILIDQKTGQVLAAKNENERMYPASTTKIMTAILAIEKGDMNQLMTASAKAADPGDGGMNIGINAGEQLILEDLLNALLIKSANETANIIAENIGPTYNDFIASMNAKATELGAVNTHFVNPNGMHDDNHYTTARDLSTIARYAMTLDKFREIVKRSKYDMHVTNKHEKWDTLYTSNKLLKNLPGYKSDLFEAIGVKTGYTSNAGHNLVSAAVNENGMELLAVVMGVRSLEQKNDVYTCSKELLEYGYKNYSIQTIVNADQLMKNIAVEDAQAGSTLDLVTETGLSAVLPNGQDINSLERKVEYSTPVVKAPVTKGQTMGYVEYIKDGVVLGKVNIVASRAIEKSPKAVARDTVQKTAANPILKRVIIGILAFIVALISLRFVLKRISRYVKREEAGNIKRS